MNEETTQRIALMMAFIVVMLPFYVAEASAASMTITATGRDGIPHYRAENDELNINVTVSWSGREAIGPANLRVTDGDAVEFSCNPTDTSSGTFLCLYSYPEYATRESPLTFTLQLFEDDGQAASIPTIESLTVDYNPPTGTFTLAVEEFDDDERKFVGTYDIDDTACDGSACGGKCGGVGSVEFTSDGASIGSVTVNETGCTADGTVNLSLALGSTSTKDICMVMTDKLGNEGEECEELVVDGAAPVVTGVDILDALSSLIVYTNGQPIATATIRVNVTEDSEIVNITMNAQELDERSGSTLLEEITLSCYGEAPEYTCDAPFFLFVAEAKTASLTVNTEDNHGNKAESTLSLSILVDSTPPAISRVYSGNIFEGLNFLTNSNNTLLVDILEDQAGMGNNQVVMDLGAIGAYCLVGSDETLESDAPTSSNCIPNECYTSGIGWTCEWNYITIPEKESGDVLTASVTAGHDNAGNPIAGEASAAFYVDKDAPKLVYVNITSFSEEYSLRVARTGDSLEVAAIIAERTEVEIYGNFTEILGEGSVPIIEGSCEEFVYEDEEYSAFIESKAEGTDGVDLDRDTLFECLWVVGPITGYEGNEYPIHFNMADAFGQNETEDWEMIIYSVLDELPETYWEIDTGECGTYEVNSVTPRNEGYGGRTGGSSDKVEFIECPALSPSTGADRLVWHLRSQAFYQEFKMTSPLNSNDIQAEILFFDWNCDDGTDYLNTDPETNAPSIYLMGYDDRVTEKFDIFYILTNPNNMHEPSYADAQNQTVIQNAFVLNCTAGIITLDHKRNAVSPLEIQNFTITIPVYNNPMGMPLANVRLLINQTQDSFLVKGGWISTIKQLFAYAEVLCNTISALITIATSLAGIKDIFSGCADTVVGSPACTTQATTFSQTASQGRDLAGKTFQNLYSVFCGLFIQCRATDPDQFKDEKTGECDAFCEFASTWAEINRWYSDLVGGFFEIKFQSDFTATGTIGGNPNAETRRTASAAGDQAYSMSGDNTAARQRAERESTRQQTTGVEDTGARWFPDSLFASESFDPKQSMFVSAFTACLPGVFIGIEKLRQIECQYLMCLKTEAANGRPVWQCDAEKGYAVCAFWTGQILNAIPLMQYFSQLSDALKGLIDDPISAIGMVIPDLLCKAICESTLTVGCSACHLYQYAAAIASTVIGTYKSFENWKYIGVDVCKEAVKEHPDPSAVWPE